MSVTVQTDRTLYTISNPFLLFFSARQGGLEVRVNILFIIIVFFNCEEGYVVGSNVTECAFIHFIHQVFMNVIYINYMAVRK